MKISGVIITYNEERNIAECIRSLEGVVDEVVVVDSFSTDKTKAICESLNVKFVEHKFEGHIEQKNFAMDQASFDYILSLDADERLSEAMKDAILEVKSGGSPHAGYSFNRLNNYCGAWLKRSWYPDRKLRLWDRQVGRWGGTNPHDKVILNNPHKTILLRGDILHFAYENLEEHFEQVKKFAVIAANAKYKEGKKANFLIHIVINPWFKFFKRYILKLGFLDGYYGFAFCLNAALLNYQKYLYLYDLNKKKNKGGKISGE